MKLITHIRPHLDDICAMWLFARFVPEAADATFDFAPNSASGGDMHDGDDRVCIGIGRGKYDEHKGDVGDCATTLVWKDVQDKVRVDDVTRAAIGRIVEWVLLEDTGKLNTEPHRFFSVPSMIDGFFDGHDRDSAATNAFGFTMLDALLVSQRNEVRIAQDWKGRVEFDSRYGRAVAVVGQARQVDAYAYAKGFPLVLIMSADRTYHTIRADANSDIDLTPTWEKIRAREPKASWYFHHSKKMLICGGDHHPNAVLSKMSLKELVETVK
jgi:hypothetical protein